MQYIGWNGIRAFHLLPQRGVCSLILPQNSLFSSLGEEHGECITSGRDREGAAPGTCGTRDHCRTSGLRLFPSQMPVKLSVLNCQNFIVT